jgi:hypothetical protein
MLSRKSYIKFDILVFFIDEHPVLEMIHSLNFIKNISAGDSQGQESIRILSIDLDSFLEKSNDLFLLLPISMQQQLYLDHSLDVTFREVSKN